MKWVHFYLIIFFFLSSSCSGFKKSEKRRIRKYNEHKGKIFRLDGESFFSFAPITRKELDVYPWEKREALEFPKITKEFFRCKGSQHHPYKVAENDHKEVELYDCDGINQHGLPIKQGQEFIYPILIELLNFLQVRLHQRVVITSGHRCPKHEQFVCGYGKEKLSKHQMGAEVDFYVECMEESSYLVIEKILDFFCNQKKSLFRKKDLGEKRVSWSNSEVIVTLTPKESGRNEDNMHFYAYITVELKYDREEKTPIVCTWRRAHYGYRRN